MGVSYGDIRMKKNKWLLLSLLISILFITSCGITQSKVKREREGDMHYKLGWAFLNENNLQKAYVEFQQAIQLNPDDKTYYYAMGYVYVGLGKLKDAVEAYNNAIKIDPAYGEAFNSLGAVYGKMEKWDEAINEYKKALNIPEYATPQLAHYNLGYAYYSKGDYNNAILELKEAARLQPEMALFHVWLGYSYVKLGMIEDAKASFESVRKLDPTNAESYFNLGLIYLKEGKKDEALEAFKKVVEIAPKGNAASDSMKYIDMLKK